MWRSTGERAIGCSAGIPHCWVRGIRSAPSGASWPSTAAAPATGRPNAAIGRPRRRWMMAGRPAGMAVPFPSSSLPDNAQERGWEFPGRILLKVSSSAALPPVSHPEGMGKRSDSGAVFGATCPVMSMLPRMSGQF